MYCNEEEIEGFDLWKEEVQTLKSHLSLSLNLNIAALFVAFLSLFVRVLLFLKSSKVVDLVPFLPVRSKKGIDVGIIRCFLGEHLLSDFLS